tara:strand:- start:5233 stop:5427 length:195 start_codon:yes stop_codon:yes gene_type:complete
LALLATERRAEEYPGVRQGVQIALGQDLRAADMALAELPRVATLAAKRFSGWEESKPEQSFCAS